MLYLIGQIIVCLLIAAILGFIVGWLLRAAGLRDKIAALESELQSVRREHQDCARKLAQSQRTNTPPVPETAQSRDNLKRISGIGAVLEKHLNGLGIFTFRQIADFTPADVQRISATLKQFHGRIEREQWVEQAQELHKRTHKDNI